MLSLHIPDYVRVLLIYVVAFAPILLLSYFELSSRRSAARELKGCRKLGLRALSNLDDEQEYNLQGTKGQKSSEEQIPNPRIKALIAYPIKSCAGIEFNIADIVETGLAYDRQFCFAEYIKSPATSGKVSNETTNVSASSAGRWDCRTLRDGKYSRMALIRPEIWVPDPSSTSYSPNLPEIHSKGVLVINYPRTPTNTATKLGMKLGLCRREESFHVPLHPPPKSSDQYPLTPLRMFSRPIHGLNYSTHLPKSLMTFLSEKNQVSLFRVSPTHQRPVHGNAPTESTLGFQPVVGFPDEYPLQMQNLSSVRDIAEHTKYAIPKLSVRRFRPNIVLEGAPAYVEDHWKMVRFNNTSPAVVKRNDDSHNNETDSLDVHVSCRTIRCRLPNVDPDTGERHLVEPDKTLRTIRCIDASDKTKGCLGMMLVPAAQKFTLHVGDELEVLETGDHFYTQG